MVEECCKFVNQTPDLKSKIALIDTLRTVSEGKVSQNTPRPHPLTSPLQIYVEVPRARLTMELAKIRESEGNISDAADVLQELQVSRNGGGERHIALGVGMSGGRWM